MPKYTVSSITHNVATTVESVVNKLLCVFCCLMMSEYHITHPHLPSSTVIYFEVKEKIPLQSKPSLLIA